MIYTVYKTKDIQIILVRSCNHYALVIIAQNYFSVFSPSA